MEKFNLTFGNYECSMHVNENSPQTVTKYSLARHCNVEYELFVVLRGSATIDVEDTTYSLEVGDALLIAPTKFHCFIETSDDIVNFTFPFMMHDSSASKAFFRQVSPCVSLRLSDFTVELCRRIIEEMENHGPFWQESVKAKHSILIVEILRALSDATSNDAPQENIGFEQRFAIIDTFFAVQYGKYGTENLLAEKLHISRRQLNRILLTHYGMNFRQKLLHSRMDRAAWLLRTTDLPICEISESVGYISETSFYKAFKGHHNTTPQLYRKSFTKEN